MEHTRPGSGTQSPVDRCGLIPEAGFLSVLKSTSNSFCLWKMTDSKTTILPVLAGGYRYYANSCLGSAELTIKILFLGLPWWRGG